VGHPPPNNDGLIGGNYNFDYTSILIQGTSLDVSSMDCFASRCGDIDSLHFHTSGDLIGTFHMDTANPLSMLGLGGVKSSTL
jgi:hypothetical protein